MWAFPNLSRYFKQSKLTSFQRQVNLYGFRRLTAGKDRGAYYNELFLRGRPDLATKILRCRVKGTGFKSASSPATEPDFYKMHPCIVVVEEIQGPQALKSQLLESPKTVVTPILKSVEALPLLSLEDNQSLGTTDDLMDSWGFKFAAGPMSLQSIAHSLANSSVSHQHTVPCPITPESQGQKLLSADLSEANLAMLSPIEESPSPSPVPFYHTSYRQAETQIVTFQDVMRALVNTDKMVIEDSYDPLLLLDEVVGNTC
jgi:hypothetical protein